MNHQYYLQHVLAKKTFDHAQMIEVMDAIVSSKLNSTQTAALLACMRFRGETDTEIAAAAQYIRHHALPCIINDVDVIDIVGTGGDASHTFNVSTAAAIVAAAAGAFVAKHGNRAASSRSGSADLLQAAHIPLNLSPQHITQCIKKIGIGFLFAPHFHQIMQHVKTVRQELGIRTLFNIIGPLCNPSHPRQLLIGVFSHDLLNTIAKVLPQLDYQTAMVVHAEDGLDEISAFSPTNVVELRNQHLQSYTINPADFVDISGEFKDIQVDSAEQSLAIINAVFANQLGAALNMVLLNAGAAIYLAGLAANLAAGVDKARSIIQTGLAKKKFAECIRFTQNCVEIP